MTLEELRATLGDAAVLTGEDMAPYLVDWRGVYDTAALAVLRPASTEQVAQAVKHCADAGLAMVNQGGNTGLSGGTAPTDSQNTVILNLGRMNSIEEVNANQWTMTVQAGVTIQAMQEAAAEQHRLFAPDWGARGTATVGGGIATDAGGTNVLRYGNMRDQVLGLEVVLADGQVWDGLRALRKDSSGYDLKQLFIGSEGTLGVITRAVVKLLPATPHRQSALASLTSLTELMPLYELAQHAAPGLVTAFELIPDVGIERVCEVYNVARPTEARSEFYVLLKLASSQQVTDALTRFLSEAAAANLITDAIMADSPEQEERLWMIRDELPAYRLWPDTQAAGIKMDTAVPINRIMDYHDGVRALANELTPDAFTYGFGHVGDGNIHMMVMPSATQDIPAFLAAKPELRRRIDHLTFDLGGTLSAEHGVGRELIDRVGGQKPAVEWQLMRTIKAALDPNNLMNPGALLPEPAQHRDDQ